MKRTVSYYLVCGLLLFSVTEADSRLKNFCYFTNWSNKLASFDARFEIRDINATLCSHLVYAFANIDEKNIKLVPSQTDDDNGQLINKKGRYFDFNKLKINHPGLVTLLSVGGAAARNGGFVQIVNSPETMKLFSKNVATYLRDRDFDGINIDWEWPGEIYRYKFTTLLKIMRHEFEKEAAQINKPRLLITISVAVGEETITNSYNISSISRDVDYIQIMAYDFHGPWSDVTSFTAPLFSRVSNPRFNQQLSQAWAVDRWISGGAPRDKLIMGLTSSATSFTLTNRSLTDVGSSVDGPGKRGPYLGNEGHVTHYRVCEMIKNGAIHHWDNEQKMAYAYMDDQWVGYGNPKSMKEKVKFAYSRGIAGVMFWTLDQDDFLGHYCNDGEYPLLTAIYNSIIELAPQKNKPIVDVSSSTTHSTTPIDFHIGYGTNQNETARLKNFCYFTNWSNKLASFDARFEIRDINATLCSHLIYAFANIDEKNIKLIPSQTDDDNGQLINKKGRYFDFNKLKINHPDLVTLLSVGGVTASNGGFVQIVNSQETMKLFSKNVATYLRDRDFDGIHIDWEWPSEIYRNKYTQLLKVLRLEFEKEADRTSKPRLLISIAVAVGEGIIDRSYNITSISRDVDYIQIMAFDFHGPWSDVTSFSAPLFSRVSNPKFNQQRSQAWAVDRWISGGAPRDKLIMGLTSSAISFTLTNKSVTDVGSRVHGAGKRGPYLGSKGHVTYYRVCEMIKNGAIHHWDDEQKMAYAYMDDQWVGYGNPKSMKEKVKFAYSRGIAGVMFWTLDQDDFHGQYCNDGDYPLLTAIYNSIIELGPAENETTPDVYSSTNHPSVTAHFSSPGLPLTTPTDSYLNNGTIKNKASELKNFCYFTNWSNKLSSFDARFDIRDINASLCSHLIYAFADIDVINMTLAPSQRENANDHYKNGRYFEFNVLKVGNPKLVTLLSVGGSYAGDSGFIKIVHSTETMEQFSRNAALYLRDYKFDGISINWEWPGIVYRNKYTALLKIIRREFEKEAVRTSKPRLLISIAVAAWEEVITSSYNISSISRDVDYIEIMTYDFHGSWSDMTSFGTPLFSRASNPRFDPKLSQAWAVDRWISGGAPSNKLIVCLSSTGISFTLTYRTHTGVGSQVYGPGRQGPYIMRAGQMTYYRVCEMVNYGAIERWDEEQKMAYAYLEDQWVGYGNPKSMKEKVKFAYSRGIAGVMFYTLDQDDFHGHYCNAGKYPLLTSVYDSIIELSPRRDHFVDEIKPSKNGNNC